jgi:ABC-type transport system involved in multi-copper enzyme maturation permease subunit
MREMLRRTLIGQRVGIGAVSVGLFAISLIIVHTFRALGGAEVIEAFFEMLPDGIKALLRAQGGIATDAEGYLAADYRHPLYLVAIGAYVVGASVGAVAREIERGTVLMLLAAPIPRWRYLAAKVGALAVGVVVIALASWAGTWVGLLMTGLEGVRAVVFLQVQVATIALAFAMAGIGLLVSASTSDGGQAMGITTAILVTMYFVDFLSLLWGAAEPFGPLSLFHYYDPLAVSRNDALSLFDVGVLLGVGVIGTASAFVVFQRRDIMR